MRSFSFLPPLKLNELFPSLDNDDDDDHNMRR